MKIPCMAGCFLALGALLPTGHAAESLRGMIATECSAIVSALAEVHTGDKEFTIAVVPFVEAGTERTRKLGVSCAEDATQALSERKPAWLRVMSRVDLPQVIGEQRLWILDVVAQGSGGKAPAGGLINKADLLLVGTTEVAEHQVTVRMRVVSAGSSRVLEKTARSVTVARTDAMNGLLAWVERRGGGGGDVARVSHMNIKVTAQHKDSPLDPVKERNVEEQEVLVAGDQFRVAFAADADANVYVFCAGSDGELNLVFPPSPELEERYTQQFGRPAAPQADNYCRAEWEYTAPGVDEKGTERFYMLDDTPGTNTLYFIAQGSPVPDIRTIGRRLKALPAGNARLEMLRSRFDYATSFSFRQEHRSDTQGTRP